MIRLNRANHRMSLNQWDGRFGKGRIVAANGAEVKALRIKGPIRAVLYLDKSIVSEIALISTYAACRTA